VPSLDSTAANAMSRVATKAKRQARAKYREAIARAIAAHHVAA
jgi:hypothetical protein